MDFDASLARINSGGGDVFSHNTNQHYTQNIAALHFHIGESGGLTGLHTIEDSPAPTSIPDYTKFKPCPLPSVYFTGREAALEKMKKYFFETQVHRHVFVLYGIGGAGKTQIASEFIHRYCRRGGDNAYRISFIFFVDATSTATMESSFRDIAVAAGCERNSESAVQWISELQDSWLLFIDNADDPTVQLKQYLPSGRHGSRIIITSRNEQTRHLYASGGDSSYHVSDLLLTEAISLLGRTVKLRSHEGSQSKEQLVQELGLFPLAITQAGAQMNQLFLTPQEYLQMLHDKPEECSQSNLETSHPPGLAQIWQISVQRLSPPALQLLSLFSFLHRENISEEMFSRATQQIDRLEQLDILLTPQGWPIQRELSSMLAQFRTQGGSWNRIAFRELASELANFSLIDFTPPSISLHSLLHKQMRSQSVLTPKHAELLLAVSLHGVDLDTLDYEFRSLVSVHVGLVLEQCPLESLEPLSAGVFSDVLLFVGKFKEAEDIDRSLLQKLESMLGPDHSLTLERRHHLAKVLFNEGQWKNCHDVATDVVERRKRVLGPEAKETLSTMYMVCLSLRELGKQQEARRLAQWILDRQRTVLGKDHPDSLLTLGCLALILKNLGQSQEQIKVEEELLEARLRVLGRDHPHTLAAMHLQASTFSQLGKWKQSRDMLERVLEARRRVLGPDHPHTLSTWSYLGIAVGNLGLWEESREIAEQVLERRNLISGTDHLDTLTCKNNLSYALGNLGRSEEGRKLAQECLDILMKKFGIEHLYTLAAMHHLGSTLGNLGRWEECRKLMSQVTELRRKILGPEHPYTLTAMSYLATSLGHLGRPREAKPIAAQCMTIQKRVLGPEHPYTLSSMHLVATNLGSLGQWEDSLSLIREVMGLRRKILGPRHPHTLTAQGYMAFALMNLRRWEEAKDLAEKCREAQSQTLGAKHPYTLSAMHIICCTLGNMGQWREAADRCRETMEIRREVLGDRHPDTLSSTYNLSIALQHLRLYNEAATFASEAASSYQAVYGPEHQYTKTARAHLATLEKASGSSPSSNTSSGSRGSRFFRKLFS